ncbi:hypothetical protein [Streptomyces sp. DT203]|uniref:hypothetical protein n=1 Tax=Streptomyces sp. DT203 TaxID=3393424 RepID=UPI003CEAD83D
MTATMGRPARNAVDESVAPQHEERVDCLHGFVGRRRGLDRSGDEVAGEYHRLVDQLRPPVGENHPLTAVAPARARAPTTPAAAKWPATSAAAEQTITPFAFLFSDEH